MIRIFENSAEVARAGAAHVAQIAAAAIQARGRARLAVSGGSTPGALYRTLATLDGVDWPRVEILFADERAVAPDDPDSTLRLLRETLLADLPAPGPRVHRMRADDPDEDAALAEYERLLETPLDLLLLGMGGDGHTASLFPGSPLLADRERRVALVTDSPKPPPRRMTILPRVIAEARAVMVLVTGSGKSRMVARALGEDLEVLACPIRLARGRAWFLDREAAAGLAPR